MIFSILPFMAAQADVLSIADANVSRLAASGTITATYTLKTTGRIFYNTSTATDATSDKGSWVQPNGNASRYECLATVTVGSLSSGTSGSWLDLGAADRTWTRATSSGDQTVTFTLALRLKGTTTTLKTVTITLDANSS